MIRPLRHGLAATVAVLAVCGTVTALSYPGTRTPASAEGAMSGLVYPALVAVLVTGYGGWLWFTRSRLFRRPARACRVRRVRFQNGLFVRSWLETDEQPRR